VHLLTEAATTQLQYYTSQLCLYRCWIFLIFSLSVLFKLLTHHLELSAFIGNDNFSGGTNHSSWK